MTDLVRTRPVTPMRSLRRELDRLFTEFWPWDEGDGDFLSGVWTPRTDVSETASTYIVKMDLPGLDKRDLSVDVEDKRLVVRGERKEEKKEDDENYHRMERRHGSFFRSVSLPHEVKDDQIQAVFKNGVLTITVPKAEVTAPKHIEIR